MNRTIKPLPERPGPEARFTAPPVPPVPFRGTEEDELERLKNRLLHDLLNDVNEADLYAPLRRAANDATSMAWASGFPLLVLPGLLEEKARVARRQAEHQKRVLHRSHPLRRLAA